MALMVSSMDRVFLYNGTRLPDPSPGMNINQVRDVHATTYPEIATASIEGPEQVGGKLQYTYARAVGTKG